MGLQPQELPVLSVSGTNNSGAIMIKGKSKSVLGIGRCGCLFFSSSLSMSTWRRSSNFQIDTVRCLAFIARDLPGFDIPCITFPHETSCTLVRSEWSFRKRNGQVKKIQKKEKKKKYPHLYWKLMWLFDNFLSYHPRNESILWIIFMLGGFCLGTQKARQERERQTDRERRGEERRGEVRVRDGRIMGKVIWGSTSPISYYSHGFRWIRWATDRFQKVGQERDTIL